MPCQYRAVPAVVSCALSRTRKKAQSSTKCISAGALQGTMRIRYLDWAAPLPDAGCAGAACEAEDTGDAAALAGAPDPGLCRARGCCRCSTCGAWHAACCRPQ